MTGRLYSEYAGVWDRIGAAGRPALVAMAKRFDQRDGMDKALDMRGTVRHWLFGKIIPSRSIEKSAEMWLRLNPEVAPSDAAPAYEFKNDCTTELAPNPPPVRPGGVEQFQFLLDSIQHPGPVVRVEKPAPLPDRVLLVSAKQADMARVMAILKRIGCEVEVV